MTTTASPKPRIELSTGKLNGDSIIKICFDFDRSIIETIKSVPGRRWNQHSKYWYIPEKKFSLARFLSIFEQIADIDSTTLKVKRKDASPPPQYLEKLLRKRYSPNTIKTYMSYMGAFAEDFRDRDLDSIRTEEINSYILDLIRTKNISPSQQSQRISAIKFYYEQVLGRKKQYYQLNRPKKERKLPLVLTEEEAERIFNHCNNLKHKCILMTLYSGGLRRSELINLEITDIDSKQMLIRITNSKGNKDRFTLLSETLLRHLREYIRYYRPNYWLFEGQGGGQYSATSIENIFRKALRKAKITKHATPHTLRHSFATHLLEQGVSIRYIQELMGHSSINTTEIYTHVSSRQLSKIKNPLDNLNPE